MVWQLIKRWWYLLLIPTVVAFLWSLPALSTALNPPETYGASIRFTAAAAPDEANAIAADTDNLPRSGTYEDTAYVPWLASEYVVVNLPQWVTSTSFAQEVSAELAGQGIEIGSDEVRRAFSADSARSILTVYFGWDDETELTAIATATIKVLQERNQSYFPQFANAPAQIVPLDDVEVNQTVPPMNTRLNPFIRIILGLGVGVGLATLAAYLDDCIYGESDLRKLEIEVLASIPQE